MSILDQFQYRERVRPDDARFDKLRADFPQLGPALIGCLHSDGKTIMQGATLMVYIDDGVLKWTVHHKLSRTTLFGTFKEMCLALEDVEEALSVGRYEQKRR